MIDDEGELPEGAEVEIAVVGDDDEMTPEERTELMASIERGLQEVERGETISADELMRRLRAT